MFVHSNHFPDKVTKLLFRILLPKLKLHPKINLRVPEETHNPSLFLLLLDANLHFQIV